ncbi:MAG: hypothetical protein WC521_08095 [Bdellovibrionales bacterium]|jgi:hypothetical protein
MNPPSTTPNTPLPEQKKPVIDAASAAQTDAQKKADADKIAAQSTKAKV